MNYQKIKALAKEWGVSVRDLTALAPQNDPFYMGSPAELKKAEWFADIWQRAGFRSGVHLRRIHYWIVSQREPVQLPRIIRWTDKANRQKQETDVYINVEACWRFLCDSSKPARYLELIRIEDIADNKNPDPHINANYDFNYPSVYIDVPELSDPDINLSGFSATNVQPYHLELWCEKSTMDDVLLPVCRRYGANLVTFEGEVSITACHDLISRIGRSGDKPARVFYISDFDPAGNSIPAAMSRKVEYMVYQAASELDVKVMPIALTLDQVEQYQLPRAPIKESEKRAATFERAFGTGATELDALEALYPGELASIVTDALKPYYSQEARHLVDKQRQKLHQAVKKQIDVIVSNYQPEIEALEAMVEELQAVEVDTSEYVVDRLNPEVSENGNWLFDSDRSYIDQIAYYKAHKGANLL